MLSTKETYPAEYRIWLAMIARTTNPNNQSWHNYGGRGIKVLFSDFDAFVKEIGPRPTAAHSVDRIQNDKSYEHGNVRWATRREQMNNCRKNVRLTFDGRTQTLPEWARERGIKLTTMSARYLRGWSIERIMSQDKCNLGDKVSNSKLTVEIVKLMRELYRPGDREFGSSALARRFGVKQSTVWKILKREAWKQVE